ncbi:TetR/AcrR family transcriptional repressor of bet genes [Loktanella ponticola]|uniref:HTH-type transcriptional regulator BetI n=1 Tax=Yoonia ponticola TaxID=1524255 RepID=A0A7W9BIC6_9RHOB|nr:transcriptional regulator BetI [Yoonia ponticola]MBB5720856.1 TetR/AcrR family transcriptional repressor of bet genes [Yoonia ponticola]
MPKIGMEPIRRAALVEATIAEIGAAGTLDVTVSQIAKRAGMSSALAHHYFGGKDQIFLAAMRHILTEYGAEVRIELSRATNPGDRARAIIRASFAQSCFAPATVSAWMTFYVQAQTNPEALHLLRIYQRRLRSNLTSALRPLCDNPQSAADMLAALIDGLYIRAALTAPDANPEGQAFALLSSLTKGAA